MTDLQGEGRLIVRGDEGHPAVDDDEAVGHLVQGARLGVPAQLLVAGPDQRQMALSVLIEGADPPTAVEHVLITPQGQVLGQLSAPVAVVSVGLDAEQFVGRVRHHVADGFVDLLDAAEDAYGPGVGTGRASAVHPHQRFERRGQSGFPPPLLGDTLCRDVQHPVQGDGRGDRLQPVGFADARLQQPIGRQAWRRGSLWGWYAALTQCLGVQECSGGAEILRTVLRMRLVRCPRALVCLSRHRPSPSVTPWPSCSRIPDWAMR
ncbi:hypothetical protein RKD48_003873 [Streptomyces ambofaciens]